MAATINEDQDLTIFISHRHKDQKIADVLRKTIADWTLNKIKVYQSSDPKHGFVIGEKLNEELKRALALSDVVLLIYTVADADWSYTMWEAGVATDPREPVTRIVVLQCYESVPAPFEDQLRITLDKPGIRKFTEDFHRSPSFFLRRERAFADKIDEASLERRASLLYMDLRAAVPASGRAFIERWLFLNLTITLSDSELEKIERYRVSGDSAGAFDEFRQTVHDHCYVAMDSNPGVLSHFAFDKLVPGLTFGQLYQRWKANAFSYASLDWFTEVGEEMMRVILNMRAIEVEVPFKSLSEKQTWYLPVINRAKSENGGRQWDFRLEFYRIRPGTLERHQKQCDQNLSHPSDDSGSSSE